MKRYAISGTWKIYNKQVQQDVEEIVRKILSNGDGIITGSALGVDYIATEIALKESKNLAHQLQLYLPIALEAYCMHYFQRASEGVIDATQAKMLREQLYMIYDKAPECIIDTTPYTLANDESYFARNTWIVEACDEVYAFQVNKSKGTQDTINKAKAMGKLVHIKEYSI